MGNQMARALVNAGLAEEKKPHKHREKRFTCNKCGEVMVNEDWINAMWCPRCDNSYFIFSNKRD
jgi:ribosomal protein S27AE